MQLIFQFHPKVFRGLRLRPTRKDFFTPVLANHAFSDFALYAHCMLQRCNFPSLELRSTDFSA